MKKDKSLEDNKLSNLDPRFGRIDGKLVTTDASGNSYLDVSIKIENSRQVVNMSNLPVRVDIEIPN